MFDYVAVPDPVTSNHDTQLNKVCKCSPQAYTNDRYRYRFLILSPLVSTVVSSRETAGPGGPRMRHVSHDRTRELERRKRDVTRRVRSVSLSGLARRLGSRSRSSRRYTVDGTSLNIYFRTGRQSESRRFTTILQRSKPYIGFLRNDGLLATRCSHDHAWVLFDFADTD